MARKAKTRSRKKPPHRASWSGMLSFGMVSFPVEAVNALNRQGSDVHFHQVHDKCHSRIHYQKVCPIHGEVPNDEIVSAYETKKDKYVEIDPEELKSLRSESDRSLKIEAFVSPDTIDPVYFDGRMYYLLPDGAAGQEAYAVIAEAMEREDRYAIAHLIMSGKDQIALIRPLDGVLQMAMLNYDAEIRSVESVASQIKKAKTNARQVRLAQTLIEEWSQDSFDFTKLEDAYRDKVKDLIESKIEGNEIVAPAEEEPKEVLNLMDALRRSVRGQTKAHSRKKRPA